MCINGGRERIFGTDTKVEYYTAAKVNVMNLENVECNMAAF
jgi:hypothetical protein